MSAKKRGGLPPLLLVGVALTLLAVVALAVGCGAAAPTPDERVVEVVETVEVEKEVEPAIVEKAVEVEKEVVGETRPAPESAPPGDDTNAAPVPVAYRVNRMIIKNAELSLQVTDTDRAIDQVTQVVADHFGYILTTRTWYEDDFKYATITMGVPAEEFENTLRRLRGLALRVLDESASGTDVTDEYVDLESRLRNLEATEARIRTFLDKAKNVEEALQVNQELAEITADIEQVKGRMNYLKDRAAYSTITVHLAPEVPTPTPTATPTPTPTPTPVAWQPGETFQSATGALGSILRTVGDALIWIVVVLGPFALVLGLILWLVIYVWRRGRRRRLVEESDPPA